MTEVLTSFAWELWQNQSCSKISREGPNADYSSGAIVLGKNDIQPHERLELRIYIVGELLTSKKLPTTTFTMLVRARRPYRSLILPILRLINYIAQTSPTKTGLFISPRDNPSRCRNLRKTVEVEGIARHRQTACSRDCKR